MDKLDRGKLLIWSLGWYEVSCLGQGVGLEDLQGPFQSYGDSMISTMFVFAVISSPHKAIPTPFNIACPTSMTIKDSGPVYHKLSQGTGLCWPCKSIPYISLLLFEQHAVHQGLAPSKKYCSLLPPLMPHLPIFKSCGFSSSQSSFSILLPHYYVTLTLDLHHYINHKKFLAVIHTS